MKESFKQIEAFEYYYSLGGKAYDKTFRGIAVKFQVTERTIWNWYKKYNWKERVEQRNFENGKRLSKIVDNTKVNSKADYRALIKKVVTKFEEKLKENKIIISKPQDLNIMAQLDLLLMGEATQRDEVILIRPKRENEENSESGKSERNN